MARMDRPMVFWSRLGFISGMVMAVGCFAGSTIVHANFYYSVIYDNPPITVLVAGIYAYGTLGGIMLAVLGAAGWLASSRRLSTS
jgi:hypothetical protein